MKAVRLHKFHSAPVVDDVPEPRINGPFDVIVKIGGAGVCRTDLHIIEGQWDAAMGTPLPYILGHENDGWVHEVGSAVTNVAVGDTVILHPTTTIRVAVSAARHWMPMCPRPPAPMTTQVVPGYSSGIALRTAW